MDIAAQGKMVEQVDLDNKKEDKAANEVLDDTTTSQLPNVCDFAGDIQGDILRKIFFVGKDKYSAPGII